MGTESKGVESAGGGSIREELEERRRSIVARIAKLEERRATAKPEILDKLLAEQHGKLSEVEKALAATPPARPPAPAPIPAPPLPPKPEPKPAPEPKSEPAPEPIPEPRVELESPREEPRDWSASFPSRYDDDFPGKKFPWALVVFGALVVALIAVAYFQFATPGAPQVTATPPPVAAATPAPTPEPTPPPVDHLAKGTELWLTGGIEKATEALAELRLAAEGAPPSDEARARIVEIELLVAAASGRGREAVKDECEAASALAAQTPVSASAGRARATCEYAKKRYGPALTAANTLLSAFGKSPDDAETHLLIGRIHQANRRWDHALESYDRAAQLSPRMFEARHLAAEVRATRRDLKAAIDAETAALAIFPQSAAAAKKLAEYKASMKPVEGETEDAGSDDAFTQYYQTAVRLRNDGRTAEAAAQLDQAIALRPNASLLLTKARWVADTDPTGALEAAKRASAAGSDEAWYWIGSLESRAGRTGNAIAAYEAYLARNPGGSYAGEARSALTKLKGL